MKNGKKTKNTSNDKISYKLSKQNTISKKTYSFNINNNEFNKSLGIKSNLIDQSKYSLITFLPKALLYQFYRLANIYFLIVTIIQCIPIISPLSAFTAIAPFTFVISVSLIREGIEDYNRHKYDNQLNSEPVTVLKDNKWNQSSSGKLLVGEIVMVLKDNPFPADLILIDSNLPEGACFIETGTLDGEKTLKNKMANKFTAGIVKINKEETFNPEIPFLQGNLECDNASADLYKFDGTLKITIKKKKKVEEIISLDAKQMLLKGAILRNTEWILGFVVYTGHSTKLIMNSKAPRQKFSRVESLMTKLLIFILVLQMIFCLICAIAHSLYNTNYVINVNYKLIQSGYLPDFINGSNVVDSLISYFTYLLLLNTMIPISLMITLEIVKVIQGYYISVDVELYSFLREKYCKAGSISLNEELGQVDYIFSDKTGTLTCNRMCFKFCVIGDTCYEYNKNKNNSKFNESESDKQKRKDKRDELAIIEIGPNYAEKYVFSESKFVRDNLNYTISSLKNPKVKIKFDNDKQLINEFFQAMATAHECYIEEKNGSVLYTGLSPDDIELLNACREQGYIYMNSGSSILRRVSINGVEKDFNILNINEFNSDRKRMSIILKDGDTYKLYMKGADTEILKKLSDKTDPIFLSQATRYVDYFSQYGYRTLLLGMKVLDKEEYEEWSKRFKVASLDLANKEKEMEILVNEIESGCYLIGATVVEDKLQEKVPDCIRDLRLAGIKIWMLTGDKFNTALNIGLSCNLISNSLHIFKVKGEEGEDIVKLSNEFKKFEKKNENLDEKKNFGIVIDSTALTVILSSDSRTKLFLDMAHRAESVICCRVSPLQKAEIVRSMKEYNPEAVTLSIGDGGNDVSMIMEAHIGIGVYGEEGMRAVQASDYAVGEFMYLKRLLLFHGRINNMRISEMILYFFYKNFVFTLNHFFFTFLCLSSGQTIIDDWLITFYNMIFTAFPLGGRACLDRDITYEDGEIINNIQPFIYKESKTFPLFTVEKFILSLVRGAVHCIINFCYVIYVLWYDLADINGNTADLWFISVVIYTNILLTVSLRLLILQKAWTYLNNLVIILTGIVYVLFLIYIGNSNTYNSYGVMGVAFSSPRTYLLFLFVSGVNLLIDLSTYSYFILFMKNLTQTLRILIKEKGVINDVDQLIPDVLIYYEKYKFAIGDKMSNENKLKNNKYSNLKDIEKIDRIDINSEISLRDDDNQEIKIRDEEKKMLIKY